MASSGMASESPHPFGGTLPGDAGVIEMVNVKKLLQSRALEMEELLNALKSGDKQDMVFQRLPFVLRRRAMSHNPFRVPKKIRIHLAREMSRSVPKCTKRLRKDRRKRLNRLEEYRIRCARNQWLETHLYHAKRFKMASLWGHRIALRTNQKCRRRCLRYSKRHSVVHDMSYVRLVTVSGLLSELRQAFRGIFADSSFMFDAKALSGKYRLHTFAYATSGGTQRLICPVHFVWIPSKTLDEDHSREIWFFLHPAAAEQFHGTVSGTNYGLECSIRKDVCLFEVMGPLSALLLRGTLKVDESYSNGNHLWRNLHPENINIPPSYILPLSVMHPKLYGNQRPAFTLHRMRSQGFQNGPFEGDSISDDERLLLHNFSAPAEFNIVTKTNLPRLRRRNYGALVAKLLNKLNEPHSGANSSKTQNKEESQHSKQEDKESRTSSHQGHLGGHNTNSKPQSTEQVDETDTVMESTQEPGQLIPIWLIRRGDALGGFDLLMPAGTIARKLWILLNRYGALGIGIEEREMLYTQNCQCMFPHDYPETEAGQRHFQALEAEKIRKYLSTPGNKRPNYMLMGVDKPFSMPRFKLSRPKSASNEIDLAATSTNVAKGHYNKRLDGHRYRVTETSVEKGHENRPSFGDSSVGTGTLFLEALPEEWTPQNYLERGSQGYMESRHLLLGCVTTGIHRRDKLPYPEFQVLRVSRSFSSSSNVYFHQLLLGVIHSDHKRPRKLEKGLLLACSVEVAGHGSLCPGSRIYMPSHEDMQFNSGFLRKLMQLNQRGGMAVMGARKEAPVANKKSSMYPWPSDTSSVVPKPFDEPINGDYKLGNLKELFGCTGKRKKVNHEVAVEGLKWLEERRHPPVRRCFGVVTSRGFEHKGNCLIELKGFLDLLQSTVDGNGNKDKKATLASTGQIKLFAWIRNMHSRQYVAGIISVNFHDSVEGSI